MAFRVEKAQLELPLPKHVSEEGFGFGMEYVLIQRARLGCRVDGGGHKSQSCTHADAEIVAATLAGMLDRLDGKRMAIRMAIRVAELARAASPSKPSRTSMANALPPSWCALNACCTANAGAPSRS